MRVMHEKREGRLALLLVVVSALLVAVDSFAPTTTAAAPTTTITTLTTTTTATTTTTTPGVRRISPITSKIAQEPWARHYAGNNDGEDDVAKTTEDGKTMTRPIFDRLATMLFRLETNRVASSSVTDEYGRVGEPMEWSEKSSLANQFSEWFASNDIGYALKQGVADLVAGEFEEEPVTQLVDSFVDQNKVAMFSFSTCPFCRRAKDYLDERQIAYEALELDLDPQGNQIRAILGRKTRRTSMPAIFVRGNFIGGCNDGPGLLTLAESGELDKLLQIE